MSRETFLMVNKNNNNLLIEEKEKEGFSEQISKKIKKIIENNLSSNLTLRVKEKIHQIFDTVENTLFFTQERHIQGGELAKIFKLRTMVHNADQMEVPKGEGGSKDADDYRFIQWGIIPIGKIIRKMWIDELPQFINVMKGDMGIVGPRPIISNEYEKMSIERRKRRDAVTSGFLGRHAFEGKGRGMWNKQQQCFTPRVKDEDNTDLYLRMRRKASKKGKLIEYLYQWEVGIKSLYNAIVNGLNK